MNRWSKNQILLVTCIGGKEIERRWEAVPKEERMEILRQLDKRAAGLMERYRRGSS